MSPLTRQTSLRAAKLTMMALTTLTASRADVIQTTTVLPPASGAYGLGGVCVSGLGRCTQNATVSGFNILTSTVQNGNELVQVSATYSADIFTDAGGIPGAFLGHLVLPGTANFTYVGRNPSVNPLGTFFTELPDFDFLGALNGNTFEVKKDPTKASTGSTTISQITTAAPTYLVSSSLQIFAIYSFNGSPFTPAPPRTTDLVPVSGSVPEPGSGVLAGSILAGVLVESLRRRIRSRPDALRS